MEQRWRSCGVNCNILEDGRGERGAVVLDDLGRTVFEHELGEGEALDCAGGQLFTRRSVGNFGKQTISLLDSEGRVERELRTEGLARAQFFRKQGALILHGKYLSAMGPDIMRQFVRAYSTASGEEIEGDMPKELYPTVKLLFRQTAPHLCVLGRTCDPRTFFRRAKVGQEGDRSGSRAIYAVGYDLRLKETMKRKIADDGRIEFVCKSGNLISGVVGSTTGKGAIVFTCDMLTGSVRTAPLEARRSRWRGGVVLGDDLVVWGPQEILWVHLKSLEIGESRASPGTEGYGFAHGAATWGGQFALVYNHSYHKRPLKILVYGRTGEPVHDIALRPGWVERVKFVHGGELLVLATRFVARIRLRDEGRIPADPGSFGGSFGGEATKLGGTSFGGRDTQLPRGE